MDGKQNVLNKQAILMHKDKIRVLHHLLFHCSTMLSEINAICCNARQTIPVVKIRIDKNF